MKHPSFLLLIPMLFTLTLYAQVPDSTFGVPNSFEGPGTYWPAVTGSDFGGREDRCFSTFYLPSGKIIQAGQSQGNNELDFALVHLLQDGTFDSLAGYQGQIRIDLGYQHDSCLAAILYDQEQIVMGGCVSLPGGKGYVNLLTRVDTNGQIDFTFGNNGKMEIDLPANNEMITKMIGLHDGRILIAGNAFYGTSFDFPDSTAVFVGRLLPNGQVDSTFGKHGFLYCRYEYTCKSSLLGDIAVDHKGRIILSGGSYSPYPGVMGIDKLCKNYIHVHRYLNNGKPDVSFGNQGQVELTFKKGRATSILIENDDRILIAGMVTEFFASYPAYTLLVRLLPNGSLDISFANGGYFVKYILGVSSSTEIFEIIKIKEKYYCGFVDEANGDHLFFGIIRFKEMGVIDSLFGINGIFSNRYWLNASLYNMNQIHTIDSNSIYLTGYYSFLSQDNMFISKVNIRNAISFTQQPGDSFDNIHFFPNPITGAAFFLEWNSTGYEEMSILLTDLQGRIIINKQIMMQTGINSIDLPPGLQNGVYFLSIKGNGFSQVEKCVVQKGN